MTTFWRPSTRSTPIVPCAAAHEHGASCTGEFWARCDLCRWSGPRLRFELLRRGDSTSTICRHDWCYGNEFVRQQLELDGWIRV